jgi:hypothetical protein
MTAKRKRNRGRHLPDEERRFTVRGIRRDPPDIRKFSKALISLAMAEAERQAQADHAGRRDSESEVAAEDSVQPGGEADD